MPAALYPTENSQRGENRQRSRDGSAPRFGRTPTARPAEPAGPGSNTEEVLAEIGLTAAEIAALRERHAAG